MLLFLYLLNGIQHGLGNDHLIAITTLASHGGQSRDVSLLGLRFGLGHMAMLVVLGAVALLWNFTVPAAWESRAGVLGGALLILLGGWTFAEWFKDVGYVHSHPHQHRHRGQAHEHLHFHLKARHPHQHVHPHSSTLLGALFALSGLRTLLLGAVPILQTSSLFWALVYILLFGAGIVVSMTVYGWLAGLAFNRRRHRSWISLLLGASSVTLGAYWIVTS